ncbi:TetR family transcriptional regulator [Pseudonocardia sp. ICBG1142]|uniref:TetR family transcriptional regulator n=1 Tax=Pseudonocardia sp. ICBG1142 TaxID=2846760 RepID=UPI001CF7158D|nr:TetR family transcriptional regulator [Pseudonocardia sp. ICBG1142]
MGFVKAGRDKRDSRWDAHREQRRAALVGSAIGAIRRHGAGIGMDEIAASAATSKTVIYRHFGDRTGLYTAICESVAGVLLAEVRRATAAALADSGRGPRAAVAAGIDAYLRLIEIDPELYRFVVQRPLLTQGTARRSPATDGGHDPVNDLVTVIGDEVAAVIAGNLGDPAPGETDRRAAARIWGHAIVGLVRGAADDWLARPDGTPREQLATHLTDLAWSGLSGLASHVQEVHP